MRLLFTMFGLFLPKKKLGKSFFIHTIPSQLLAKKINWNIFQFCGISGHLRHNGHFRKMLNGIFKFGCTSWYYACISQKKEKMNLRNEVQFNVKSIGTNLKSQKPKSKILVFPFLIAHFNFETYLIKLKQLNFWLKFLCFL